MRVEVKVPQLPESVAEATLVSWHKQPGAAVSRDENLIDVETVSVLRKRWLRGTLTDDRMRTAVTHLIQMNFERVPTKRLVTRATELRENVSAYDACYVALAESLRCDLLTADRRLAAATGPRCTIRVLQ